MSNILDFVGQTLMRAAEVKQTLVDAGFTAQQALGLTTVIYGIRNGTLTFEDAEWLLEQHGFDDGTAGKLSKVFFQVLASAA